MIFLSSIICWITWALSFGSVVGPAVDASCFLQLSIDRTLGGNSSRVSLAEDGKGTREPQSVWQLSFRDISLHKTNHTKPGAAVTGGATVKLQHVRSSISFTQREWSSTETTYIIAVAAALAFIILLCCYQYGSNAIGKSVVLAIEKMDKDQIGVDVEIGASSMNPQSGHIVFDGLVIRNPKGYKTEYLLKAEHILVDVSTYTAACSCGRILDLRLVRLANVTINLERSMLSSNVEDVLRFLADHAQNLTPEGLMHGQPTQKPVPGSSALRAKWKNRLNNTKELFEEAHAHKVALHQFLMDDMKVNLSATACGGRGIMIRVPDLHYSDFDQEIAKHNPMEIIHHLLGDALNSTLRHGHTASAKQSVCSQKTVCSQRSVCS